MVEEEGEDAPFNMQVEYRRLLEQNNFLMQQLMNQLTGGNGNVGGANGNSPRATTLIAELEKRIKPFVFDPEEELVFPAWYQRYEHVFTVDGKHVFTVDGKALDEKSRVRLLLEKLDETCYKQYASHVTPKSPDDVPFGGTVEILKEMFYVLISRFTQRFKCWTSEFDKSESEDDQQYGDRINERFHKVMDDMTLEDYKVLRFLVGLKGRDDAEHLPFLLSFADSQNDTEDGVKLQDIIRELKKLRTYKADGQMISKPRAEVRYVKHDTKRDHKKVVSCWNCGMQGHWSNDCRQRKSVCGKCGVSGHQQQFCDKFKGFQGGNRHGKGQTYKKGQKHSKAVMAGGKIDQPGDVSVKGLRRYTDVEVNGMSLTFQTDTGSDVTTMSKRMWEKLGYPSLSPPQQTLKVANDNEFHCHGVIDCKFTIDGEQGYGPAYVVDGQSLLGLEWMDQCGRMKRKLDAIGYAKKISSVPTNIAKDLQEKFPKMFEEGLGKCLKERAKLDLKAGAKPRFFKPRPVQHAAFPSVEEELDRLLKLEVVEKVNHSDWAAPIVAVKKKSGVIRVCADFSTGLNAALEDNEHPLPVPEDIFASLNGGKIFSQIDLSDAYLQVEVDEGSRHLVTINTHRGLYQYKRLPFGVKTAPAIFQSVIDKMCSGLKGVVCYLDDIMVMGNNNKDHYENLIGLFGRISDYGFKLKPEKCSFNQEQIKFLGYIVDKEGRRPDPAKIEAITGMPAPENVGQLRSFLGMVSYYGNFIPKVKEKRGVLDKLTHQDVKWNWGKTHAEAFERIKKVLASDLNLVHYSPDLPIVVAADACEYGVGGVICHRMADGSEKPIQHFSRALLAAEKNYGQIEKEALALIIAVKKFHKYIYGRKFTLQTDHKPLLTIFGGKKGLPGHSVNRLIRWGIILLGYNFDIEYINTLDFGKADALSRLISETRVENEDIIIAQIELDTKSTFVNCIRSLPVTEHQIRAEIARDRVLKEVAKRVQLNSWSMNSKKVPAELAPYYNRRNELSVVEGCLLFGERVVVPSSLRVRVARELHRGHPGNVRMKQLARSYVFWPGMDQEIEKLVKLCDSCQLAAKSPAKVAICPWPKPKRVWQRIHIDFAGPENGIFYFVVVDALSKWPEIVIMRNITSRNTVSTLEKVFTTFGFSETIVSDNGTQFTSKEFKEMCQEHGIEHIRTVPYFPQSNGQAERFVDTLKRGLKKFKGEVGPIEDHLNRFLFAYRTTPNATLENLTPAEVCMGRRLRTHLTLMLPEFENRKGIVPTTGLGVDFDTKGSRDAARTNPRLNGFVKGETVRVKSYQNNSWTWKRGVVFERVGKVNYRVTVGTKTSLFHANQMRHADFEASPTEREESWLDSMMHTFNLPVGTGKVKNKIDAPVSVEKQKAKSPVVIAPKERSPVVATPPRAVAHHPSTPVVAGPTVVAAPAAAADVSPPPPVATPAVVPHHVFKTPVRKSTRLTRRPKRYNEE